MKKRIAVFMAVLVLVLGVGVGLNFNFGFNHHFFGRETVFAADEIRFETGPDGNKKCFKTSTGEPTLCPDEGGDGGNKTTSAGDSQIINLPNPFGTDPATGKDATIETILKNIIDWLIIIGAPIATGMIIFGAYQMLFAAGDPAKFKTGRTTILYTVIGYGIILIGWGIASIIKEILNLKPVV